MVRAGVLLLAFIVTADGARADDAAEFMQRFSGAWQGTGEFLIGPEDGVAFRCTLEGELSRAGTTFGMTGRCSMGAFSAAVHAKLRYNAETDRFYGDFLGGSEGDGLDLVGMREGDGFSLELTRGAIQGRLAADPVSSDQMRVVVYYRDQTHDRELPVVAMGFMRDRSADVDLPDQGDRAAGTLGPGD